MIEVVREQALPAAAEAIWPLVDDPARLPEWFAFADRGELLSGSGIGRRQRMYGHWGKKSSEIDQLVVEYDPPRRIAWRHEAERLNGKPAPRFAEETLFSIDLRPADGGTHVVLHSRQRPAGPLRGAIIRLFGRREVAQNLDRSLARLRETLGAG